MELEYLMDDGFTYEQATFLLDCERWCDQHYEYETEHPDAAGSYAVCLEDLDDSDIKAMRFDYWPVAEPEEQTVYLGNSECEIQLPRALTKAEAEYFSRNTDYAVNYREHSQSSEFAYRAYDTNLVAVAELYESTAQ